ncbi:MAG: DUF3473 domain-containing protein [Gammaproteobacteria bacterium]|nr:DUF3473 domain-containing protein [Gammaproteobacteria bacterium]
MSENGIENAFTIDVEDYFQVSAFENDIKRSEWDSIESRVVNNTQCILRMLDKHNIKATFFILGWVAERNKQLVMDISSEGHEIASHGYSHKLIYNQSKSEFRDETLKAKHLLEDIIQKPVNGYRAASYSITKDSLWALDILANAGFKYDSSIYPVVHDRYGIPDAQEMPYVINNSNGQGLIEFPLSVYKIINYNLPVSGGGYFRLYPYFFTKYALASINECDKPFVFYLHPWEVDPGQPRIATNLISRFRHYNNLDRCEERLNKLLNDFNFTTMINVLKNQGYEMLNIDHHACFSNS